MSKRHLTFICQNCGAAHGRWQGKCEGCGAWNTLSEEGPSARPAGAQAGQRSPVRARAAGRQLPRRPAPALRRRRIRPRHRRRLRARSVLLMAGDPGIGKSTLLLQAAAALARTGQRAVYISGEEAVAQVRLRAERLGSTTPPSNSPPRPRSRTSSPRSRTARPRAWSSSIPSRPCGPIWWNRRPAR